MDAKTLANIEQSAVDPPTGELPRIVVLFYDGADWWSQDGDAPGLSAFAPTPEGALAELRTVVRLAAEVRAEAGE